MESLPEEFFVNPRRRIPLWLFIIELLDVDVDQKCLGWTYEHPYEFMVKNPDELAALWGSLKENPTMTYAKLTRGLRYYYGKNIIEKVRDRPFTYRFAKSKKTERFLKKFKFDGKASNSSVAKGEYRLDTPQSYIPLPTIAPSRKIASASLSEGEFYIDLGKVDIKLDTSLSISAALQALNTSGTISPPHVLQNEPHVDFTAFDEILSMM